MKKMDIARLTPRWVTVLLAKTLLRLMRVDYRYDIILYTELARFIEDQKTEKPLPSENELA